jgi:hypothetical protein
LQLRVQLALLVLELDELSAFQHASTSEVINRCVRVNMSNLSNVASKMQIDHDYAEQLLRTHRSHT